MTDRHQAALAEYSSSASMTARIIAARHGLSEQALHDIAAGAGVRRHPDAEDRPATVAEPVAESVVQSLRSIADRSPAADAAVLRCAADLLSQ